MANEQETILEKNRREAAETLRNALDETKGDLGQALRRGLVTEYEAEQAATTGEFTVDGRQLTRQDVYQAGLLEGQRILYEQEVARAQATLRQPVPEAPEPPAADLAATEPPAAPVEPPAAPVEPPAAPAEPPADRTPTMQTAARLAQAGRTAEATAISQQIRNEYQAGLDEGRTTRLVGDVVDATIPLAWARNWNEYSPTARAINLALDALVLVPIAGPGLSVSAKTARLASVVNRAGATLRAEGLATAEVNRLLRVQMDYASAVARNDLRAVTNSANEMARIMDGLGEAKNAALYRDRARAAALLSQMETRGKVAGGAVGTDFAPVKYSQKEITALIDDLDLALTPATVRAAEVAPSPRPAGAAGFVPEVLPRPGYEPSIIEQIEIETRPWTPEETEPAREPARFPTVTPRPEPDIFPDVEPSPRPDEFPDVEPSPRPDEFPDVMPRPRPDEFPDVEPSPRPDEFPDVEPSPRPDEFPDVEPRPRPDEFPDVEPLPRPSPERGRPAPTERMPRPRPTTAKRAKPPGGKAAKRAAPGKAGRFNEVVAHRQGALWRVVNKRTGAVAWSKERPAGVPLARGRGSASKTFTVLRRGATDYGALVLGMGSVVATYNGGVKFARRRKRR